MDLLQFIKTGIILYTSYKYKCLIYSMMFYVSVKYLHYIDNFLIDSTQYDITNPIFYVINRIVLLINIINYKGYEMFIKYKKNNIIDYIEIKYNKINSYFIDFQNVVYEITKKNILNFIDNIINIIIINEKLNINKDNIFEDTNNLIKKCLEQVATKYKKNTKNNKTDTYSIEQKNIQKIEKIINDLDITISETNKHIYTFDSDNEFEN